MPGHSPSAAATTKEPGFRVLAKSADAAFSVMEKGAYVAAGKLQGGGFSFDGKDFFGLIYGPANVDLVDREGDRITGPALRKMLPGILKRKRFSFSHIDILPGEIWDAVKLADGTEVRTEVRPVTKADLEAFPEQLAKNGVQEGDEALFCVGAIYKDRLCEPVWKGALAGELNSFSISGKAFAESKKIECTRGGYACKLVNQITDMEGSAVTICKVGMNQAAGFIVLLKGADDVIRKSAEASGHVPGAAGSHVVTGLKQKDAGAVAELIAALGGRMTDAGTLPDGSGFAVAEIPAPDDCDCGCGGTCGETDVAAHLADDERELTALEERLGALAADEAAEGEPDDADDVREMQDAVERLADEDRQEMGVMKARLTLLTKAPDDYPPGPEKKPEDEEEPNAPAAPPAGAPPVAPPPAQAPPTGQQPMEPGAMPAPPATVPGNPQQGQADMTETSAAPDTLPTGETAAPPVPPVPEADGTPASEPIGPHNLDETGILPEAGSDMTDEQLIEALRSRLTKEFPPKDAEEDEIPIGTPRRPSGLQDARRFDGQETGIKPSAQPDVGAHAYPALHDRMEDAPGVDEKDAHGKRPKGNASDGGKITGEKLVEKGEQEPTEIRKEHMYYSPGYKDRPFRVNEVQGSKGSRRYHTTYADPKHGPTGWRRGPIYEHRGDSKSADDAALAQRLDALQKTQTATASFTHDSETGETKPATAPKTPKTPKREPANPLQQTAERATQVGEPQTASGRAMQHAVGQVIGGHLPKPAFKDDALGGAMSGADTPGGSPMSTTVAKFLPAIAAAAPEVAGALGGAEAGAGLGVGDALNIAGSMPSNDDEQKALLPGYCAHCRSGHGLHKAFCPKSGPGTPLMADTVLKPGPGHQHSETFERCLEDVKRTAPPGRDPDEFAHRVCYTSVGKEAFQKEYVRGCRGCQLFAKSLQEPALFVDVVHKALTTGRINDGRLTMRDRSALKADFPALSKSVIPVLQRLRPAEVNPQVNP